MSAKRTQRTFAGIKHLLFTVHAKLSISNRLHVYKTGSGESEVEHIEQVCDISFATMHGVDDFLGSEYQTALAYDPDPHQAALPDMENKELKAQPVKSVTIDRQENTYGLVMFGGRKDLILEPQHGIILKTVDILSGYPLSYLAHWTAKGIPYSQAMRYALMELAHQGILEVQFEPFTTAQVDQFAKKTRQRKAHPNQGDLTEELNEGGKARGKAHREKYPDGDEEPEAEAQPKRQRGRPKKTELEIAE